MRCIDYLRTAAENEYYGESYTNNDVIGILLDMDAGTLDFFKNGIHQGLAYNQLPSKLWPCVFLTHNEDKVTVRKLSNSSIWPPETLHCVGMNRPLASRVSQGIEHYDL
jgi:hypothetical protein